MQILSMLFMVVALLAAPVAWAQAYPARPVRVIVPFSVGGAVDIVTRLVCQKLTVVWGQPIVVDNRTGASGNIGGNLAAKATPNGYTLFMTSGSVVTANQHLFKKMPFNPSRDFSPVTKVASGPQALVVNPNFPAKNVEELIALAKIKPQSILFGSLGFGTQIHLAGVNFIHKAGIDVTHVPYVKLAALITDILGNQSHVAMLNLPAAIAFVKHGKLRALAVTSKERTSQLPDVPAVAETLPGFENSGWSGIMVPTGTPQAIVHKIYRDVAKVLESEDVRQRMGDLGMIPVGDSPMVFARAIREESARWEMIIRERKLQLD